MNYSPLGLAALAALATLAPPAFFGCTTSGTLPPAATDGGLEAAVVTDAAPPTPPPPTWACAGDATQCLSGKVDSAAFTAPLKGGTVELFRVFPSGGVAALQTQPLALDDTFAFSGLAAWAHYYVKVTAHFGAGMTAASVGTVAGRFVVPSGAAPIAISVLPVEVELLETGAGANRQVQWVSAYVYDPGTGARVTSGTVTFSSSAIAPMSMPYRNDDGGPLEHRFYLAFTPPLAATTGYQVTAQGKAWNIATESDFTGAVTTPADGSTVPLGQPLIVTWPAQSQADYMSIELFAKGGGGSFTSVFSSGDPLAPDTTTLTLPSSAVAKGGSYLLNVNSARAACHLGSDGCAYLLEAGTANLTVQ